MEDAKRFHGLRTFNGAARADPAFTNLDVDGAGLGLIGATVLLVPLSTGILYYFVCT